MINERNGSASVTPATSDIPAEDRVAAR